jgi:hypothetical protein
MTASERLWRTPEKLDTRAISRHVSKPSRARGGLPPATLRRIRDYVDSQLYQNIELESLAATAELSLIILPVLLSSPKGQHPIPSY